MILTIIIATVKGVEVRSQLYIASDVGYIAQKQFDEIHSQAEEVARIIGGLRASLKKKKSK